MTKPRLLARLLPRVLHSRPHLTLALVFGVLVGCLLPAKFDWATRALTGWNAMVLAYLAFMLRQILVTVPKGVRAQAAEQDENAGLILAMLCLAAIISITAIVVELGNVGQLPEQQRVLRYAFTAITIFGSWFLVGTLFGFHYAHIYYLSGQENRAFDFPEKQDNPDYWDFMYFSFTIAVAAQTSDVTVRNRRVRRLVLGQSVLSFFFNLVILGLSVNVGAGLINH